MATLITTADSGARRMLRLLSSLDHLDKIPDEYAEALRWARDGAEDSEDLRDSIKEKNETIATLNEELKDARERIEALEKENNDLATERDDARAEMLRLQATVDALEAQRDGVR